MSVELLNHFGNDLMITIYTKILNINNFLTYLFINYKNMLKIKFSEIKDGTRYNEKLKNYYNKHLIYGFYFVKNSKYYIGQTKNLKKRLYSYLTGSQPNHLIQKAILKYNKEDICFFIEEICSEDNIDEREIFFIKKYNSCILSQGYNLTLGGKNGKLTQEIIQKKIDSSKKQKVANYDLDGNRIKIFNSCKEAARELNIPDTCIHRSCKTKGQRNGYLFSKCLSIKILPLNYKKIKGKWNIKKYSVIDIINNQTFIIESLENVSKFINCSRKYLDNIIKRNTVYKKQFKVIKYE